MFQMLLELLFAWLPAGLWICVSAVLSVAFLIIMLKLLTVLLNVITTVFRLFIP